MAETAARTAPDIWGFLQQTIATLDEESARVQSDSDMKKLLDRWLHPKDGVLAKLEDDPFYAMTSPNGRRIFMDVMQNRIHKVESDWRVIWRSLHED